ncbi:hypothetical protein [Streptomyces sp. NPDC051173]|uniref:hypothetical protein n=1 Tax=Streptomyces sp. NPDC051173 TaxID=3155164 RepID=UPI003450B848
MPRTINWPAREEWQAKAEQYIRTQCYPWQRVSEDPATWLAADELAEVRALAVTVVKATRAALTRAGRGNERAGLNEHGRSVARDWADIGELSYGLSHIVCIARSVNAASEQVERLVCLAGVMVERRDQAAEADLKAAVEREVAERATDEGWAKELKRREGVECGPQITTITVHEDGTSTVSAPVPFQPDWPSC